MSNQSSTPHRPPTPDSVSPTSPDYVSPASTRTTVSQARSSPRSSPTEPPPKRRPTWSHSRDLLHATRSLWGRQDPHDGEAYTAGNSDPSNDTAGDVLTNPSQHDQQSDGTSDNESTDSASSTSYSSSSPSSSSPSSSSSECSGSSSDDSYSESESDSSSCHSDSSDQEELKLYAGSDKTVDEAVYDVMNDYLEHSESQSSLSSHLKTLLKYLPVPNNMPKTVPRLFRYIEKQDPSFKEITHFYCSVCSLMFVEEPGEDTICEACGSKDVAEFYSFDVEDQIKHLLENCGLAEELDKVVGSRNAAVIDSDEYIRDITGGSEYKKLNLSGYSVTLLWYTDGVRVGHGKRELWAHQFVICELPPHLRPLYIGVCGISVSQKKPAMETFLSPFAKSLKAVNAKGGVEWSHPRTGNKHKSLIFAPLGCGDAPARAGYVNGQSHNAKRPCFTCEEKSVSVPLTAEENRSKQAGNRVKRKRGFVRGNGRLRTHKRMIKHGKQAIEKSKPVMGLKGRTCMETVPGVDLSTVTYADYMHGACLGIVRLFLYLWLHVPGPWNISAHLKEMDRFLSNVRPSRDVNRIIGPLSDYASWKASECRQWLLFLSLPCLVDFLPEKYFQHWMLLVTSMFLLLTECITPGDLQRAQLMLKLFVSDVAVLYRPSDCVYNVHQLLHYPLYVKRGGPLWSNSAFFFESYNFVLIKMIHGTRNPGKELVNCIKRVHCLNILKNKVLSRQAGQSPEILPLSKFLGRNFFSNDDRQFLLSQGVNVACTPIFKRVKKLRETFTSLAYTREKRRNNYTVCYDVSGEIMYGEVKCYVMSAGKVSAFIYRYKVKHADSFYHIQTETRVSHLVPVQMSYEKDLCAFEKIFYKVIRVGDFICKNPNKFEKNL